MDLFNFRKLNFKKNGNSLLGSFLFLKSAVFVVAAVALLGIGRDAQALQAGALDPDFVNGRTNGANNTVFDIMVQPDGKSIILGSFTEYNTVTRKGIARINTDGSLDTTFDPGTGANSTITSLALQSDGKIIIIGSFTTYRGVARNYIARLNGDGTLDTSFNVGEGANNYINAVAIQSSGKIIIGGNFTSYNGTAINRIARINTDGSLDTSFTVGTGTDTAVNGIVLLSGDGMFIFGNFTSYNGATANDIARLSASGTLDTSFSTGAGMSDGLDGLVVQSDNKIVVNSNAWDYNNISTKPLFRINWDGTMDNTFSSPIPTGFGWPRVMVIQADDKIIIGGQFTVEPAGAPNGRMDYIARLNNNGTVDLSFYLGTDFNWDIYALALQADGKVLIGGSFTRTLGNSTIEKNDFLRLNTNGTVDAGFNPFPSLDAFTDELAIQSDGKILVSGAFSTDNATRKSGIFRFNADGTIDTNFVLGSGMNPYFAEFHAIAVHSNGNIFAGGSVSRYNDVNIGNIVALLPSGEINTSFQTGTGFVGVIWDIAIQSNGQILVAGNFTSYNGTSVNNLARLNDDGSLDTAFSSGVGPSSSVLAIALQSDGKIVIGGSFTAYNGAAITRVARLNTDGSLDSSFNPGENASSGVEDIGILSTGEIVIAGDFYDYPMSYDMKKLSVDGTIAGYCDVEAYWNDIISIAIQADDKIIMVGKYRDYYNNDMRYGFINRVNANFSQDNTFEKGWGSGGGTFESVAIQNNDKIIIAGDFKTYNAKPVLNFTKLEAVTIVVPPTVATQAPTNVLLTTATGVGNVIDNGAENPTRSIEWGIVSGTYTNSCSVGVGGFGIYSCSMTGLTQGTTYYVRAVATNGAGTSYGEEIIFQTAAIVAPAITTNAVTNIGPITATANASIVSTGYENPTRSIEWGTVSGIYTNSCSAGIGGIGNYSCAMTGLTQGTTYYVRAVATNSAGTGYGTEMTFQTATIVAPTVTTNAVTSVGQTTATANGSIVSTGYENPTRSIEWGTVSGIYTNSCSAGIGGIGNYSCAMTGLAADTTYYVRAKATNSVSTGYGSEVIFKTNALPPLPDLANGTVSVIVSQSDGKTLIGGNFTSYNGININRIARLNADGTLDTSFNVGTGASNYVYAMAIQADGKIIIGGYFTSYNGTAINRLARLNIDGTLDTAFIVGTGANSYVRTISIQSDGKIIIGGEFTTYNGTTKNRITRLNADGTLDATFTGTGTGTAGYVYASAIQADGKILIGGAFSTYNGTSINRIARLNDDGTLDTTFTIGAGANNTIRAMALQSDGKIMIGGEFTTYNGTTRTRIARINMNGTLDTTFVSTIGTNSVVYTISVQSDGKIIIGGIFTTYNGTSRVRLARINSDGTLDNTFVVGTGANNTVSSSVIKSDGSIIIGGDFTTYNSVSKNRIAFLNADSTINPAIPPVFSPEVITASVTAINATTATANGNVVNNGNESPTRTIEWGTVSGAYTNSCSAGVGSIGAFSCSMTGLTQSTTYYVRAKAVNSSGVAYGDEVSFQTQTIIPPTLTTTAPSSITGISATGAGNISNVGYENPTRYIEWGTISGTYTNSCSVGVGSTGNYSCSMTGLSINTTYYVRASATNSAGTGYGSEVSFTTLNLPTVTTQDVTNITAITATGNGTIVDTGGINPTRYIEWGTVSGSYPSSCNAGAGVAGAYTCTMTNLTPETTYYVRARATSIVGTTYGAEVSFQTAPVTAPTLTTNAASSITGNTALGNGNITYTGGENPTRYIEWGTVSGNYTSSCSAGVGAAGAYNCTMTGLSNYTTYYVRAKATNSIGTSYGNEVSFTTSVWVDLFDYFVYSSATQPDGKILVGGLFTAYNGTAINRIVRLNTDGTLDTTFNVGTGADSYVRSIVIQPDGKILIGGQFTTYNDVTSKYIARLNADGTLDTTFNNGGAGPSYYVNTIKLQSDGKIIIGGNFGTYNGITKGRVARLNADGTLDTTFTGIGVTGTQGDVYSIAIQSDGKVIVGGIFTNFNGVAINRIARLNVDGTLDTTFVPGGGPNSYVRAIAIQSDGQIIIGGSFDLYAGVTRKYLARINTDGTLDTTFAPATGASSAIYSTSILSDGKIIISGSFTTYNGTSRVRLARINSDGTLDDTFTVGTGAGGGTVVVANVQSDGKIIIGGEFTTFNGQGRNYFARVNVDGTNDSMFGEAPHASFLSTNSISDILAASATGNGNIASTGGDNPSRYIEWGTASGVYTNSCSAGTGGIGVYSCNISGLTPATTYYARAKAVNTYGTSYGSEVSFTTVTLSLPAVTSQATTAISAITARGNGNVTAVGGENPERFIEWGTSSGVYTSSCTAGIGAAGVYSCAMTNLSPYSTYYVRAKAINSVGTVYGSETSFTNLANLIEETTPNEFQGAGTAQGWRDDDGAWVYALPFTFNFYGTNYSSIKVSSNGYICLNTAYACTAYNQALTGTNNGPIISALGMDLKTNTNAENNIYITEATNSATIRWSATQYEQTNNLNFEIVLYDDGRIKINYGTQLVPPLTVGAVVGILYGDGFVYTPSIYNNTTNFDSINTSLWIAAPITAPSVTTINASDITVNSAGLNGNVTDSGNDYVAREIEWGTASGVYSNSCSTSAGGVGPFHCNISGLIPNTTYYYRAKTVNSIGTAYGNELNFQTLEVLAPVVTTNSVSNVTSINAIANANISVTGNEKPMRSIEWGTSSGNYSNNCNLGVGDAGTFSCLMSSLSPDTTYYIRAKATNSSATTYGDEISFQTRLSDAGGETDLSFFMGTPSGADDWIWTTAIQTDGKILVGGVFESYRGTLHNYITRLNTDGSVDSTFHPGTGANDSVRVVLVQSDGKIIIGGDFTNYNGNAINGIARLNTDGTLDASFSVGAGANNDIHAAAIQSDGKIIIGGYFTSYNGTLINRIARLNTDGTLDTTFSVGTGANNVVRAISLQDGKIIISGDFTSHNGIVRNKIARLNTDGTLDTTFLPTTGANGTIYATAIQADGKIIIGGDFTTYNSTARSRIARINTDGTLDTVFSVGTGLGGNFTRVATITIQSDGQIIIGGNFTTYNNVNRQYAVRISIDGVLDTTFNPGAEIKYDGPNGVYAAAIQSDGKIIIGGYFTTTSGVNRSNFARINTDGSFDTTFDLSVGLDNSVWVNAIQADGKVLVGGNFISYGGVSRNGIARLNIDGTLDTAFDPGTGFGSAYTPDIEAIAIQSDGKILVGGFFDTYNGVSVSNIVRLNTDGSLDTSFDSESFADDLILNIAIQSNSKIIITGFLSKYGGISRNGIARLNADGTLDAEFDPGAGVNDEPYALDIQPDGKIIIGGGFTSYNGVNRSGIARINADGTLDTTFNPGTGTTGYIFDVYVQSDNKIFISGDFVSYNGSGVNNIARLNADGSLDTSFDIGTGADNRINSATVQSDDKIIIGGNFTSYDGVLRKGIARINADGTLDTSFDANLATGSIYCISTQADVALVGGTIHNYNSMPTGYLTKIFLGGDIIIPTFSATAPTISTITATSATATSSISSTGGENPTREIEWGIASGTYTNSCSAGVGTVGDYSCAMTSLTPETTYYVRAKATNSAGTAYGEEVSFITSAALVGPQLITPTPANNAAQVLVGINIVSKFDRIVEKGNGKIHIKKKSDDSIIESIDVEDPNITGWGTDTLTIDPTNDLPANTEIYINIDSGALIDSSADPFSGISDTTTWTFTTGEAALVGPQLITPTPANNAAQVLVGINIVSKFDRIVEKGNGKIHIKKKSDDSIIESIDVEDPNITGWGTDTLTIDPTNDLPANTEIYINIDSGALIDSSADPFSGISDTTTWTFTTQADTPVEEPVTPQEPTVPEESVVPEEPVVEEREEVRNDLSIEIINIRNIKKDSLDLRVEIEGNHKNDDKFDFKVEIKNKKTGKKQKIKLKKVKISDANKATLEITDLLPDTEYSFQVKVSEVDKEKYSKLSDAVKEKTKEDDAASTVDTTEEDTNSENTQDDPVVIPADTEQNNENENEEGDTDSNNKDTSQGGEGLVSTINPASKPGQDNSETITEQVVVAVVNTTVATGLLAAIVKAVATTPMPFIPLTPRPLQAPLFVRLASATKRRFMGVLRFLPLATISSKDRASIPFYKQDQDKFWGVVFDSYTKQPVADVLVYLMSLDKKRIIEQVITDKEGRFGFLIGEAGQYEIKVKKGNYALLTTQVQDSLYGKIYTAPIDFKEGDVFNLNLALEAKNFNWDKFAQDVAKKYNSFFFRFLKYLLDLTYFVGMLIAIYNVAYYPNWINYLVAAFYGGLIIYRFFFKDKKSFGTVTKKENHKPLPFSVVALHDMSTSQRVKFAISDVLGRYYLLAKNGNYLMKLKYIDMTGGSFEKEKVTSVSKGIYKEDLEV